jgi:hypothetical protein
MALERSFLECLGELRIVTRARGIVAPLLPETY